MTVCWYLSCRESNRKRLLGRRVKMEDRDRQSQERQKHDMSRPSKRREK